MSESKYMTREQIMEAFKTLGKSNGSYHRLYATFQSMKEEDPAEYDKCMKALEDMHFKDTVDLVLYWES